MDINILFGVLTAFVLVAANGYFVAAEFALVRVRSTRIDQLVGEGNDAAKVVQNQIQHLSNSLAATQLGITLASLALGWIGEPSLEHLIEPVFTWAGRIAAVDLASGLATVVSFALITALYTIFGEMVPKSIGLQRSEGTALFVARPLSLLAWLFYPFVRLMLGIENMLVHALGMQAPSADTLVHSAEELEMLVVQSSQAGILEKQEEALLRRVLAFGDKTARQVMTPRTEIVGVSTTISFEQLQTTIAEERYTRFPVYEGTLDTILGMVHIKDVFALSRTSTHNDPFDVRHLMRPVLYVPETISLDALLTQVQSKQMHIAVIIDEYGGTAGMVTPEDIMEEIVGGVPHKFTSREEEGRSGTETQVEGTSSVNGLMKIDRFAEQFGVQIEGTQANTVAGYIFEKLGRLPKRGDTIAVDNYQLQVEEMDHFRITRVRVEHKVEC